MRNSKKQEMVAVLIKNRFSRKDITKVISFERLTKTKTTIKVTKKVKHCLCRTGEYPRARFETLCGAKLIPLKSNSKNNNFYFDEFKNATFYESKISCKICKKNIRPYAGKCRKCDCVFDHRKETYCGNCGKTTRRKQKLNKKI